MKALLRNVPQEQVERLLKFRSEHPYKQINISGVRWQYISCGSGEEVLLLLHGGLRIAETAFVYIQMFENCYRVIAPTYPPLRTMDEIVDGIASMLDAEQVEKAFVLGQSYGGTVAQVFVRRYPSRVTKLILSSTHPLIASKKERLLLEPLSGLILVLLSWLPGKMSQRVFKRGIVSVLAVPGSEHGFWDAYLSDVILNRLTKADVLSLYQSSLDAFGKHAFAERGKSDWPGEVLVIGAENDPTNPERDWRKMLELYPRAQAHIILGGGHTVAMLQSDKYAAVVREFLEKQE